MGYPGYLLTRKRCREVKPGLDVFGTRVEKVGALAFPGRSAQREPINDGCLIV
jgi:hypothetical protein